MAADVWQYQKFIKKTMAFNFLPPTSICCLFWEYNTLNRWFMEVPSNFKPNINMLSPSTFHSNWNTSFLEITANVSFLCSILKCTTDIKSSNLQQVPMWRKLSLLATINWHHFLLHLDRSLYEHLKITDNYMNVWCVPPATHVHVYVKVRIQFLTQEYLPFFL